DFAVGTHHGGLAPERNRERSIGLQVVAWNVGFMERIPTNSKKGHADRGSDTMSPVACFKQRMLSKLNEMNDSKNNSRGAKAGCNAGFQKS
ncbi:hypothetical protein, partial [Pseudomonas putida]|uniref:hypothetical protein n=1 Tax=Pseudomonas putida TaxID=303 RepID=UPI002B24AA01